LYPVTNLRPDAATPPGIPAESHTNIWQATEDTQKNLQANWAEFKFVDEVETYITHYKLNFGFLTNIHRASIRVNRTEWYTNTEGFTPVPHYTNLRSLEVPMLESHCPEALNKPIPDCKIPASLKEVTVMYHTVRLYGTDNRKAKKEDLERWCGLLKVMIAKSGCSATVTLDIFELNGTWR
jgi:hypothetical protein